MTAERRTRVESYAHAARLVATDNGDQLVVLPYGTDVPGVQHDDGVTACAAIDLVRNLINIYEVGAAL